jgi:hypothetical protein
VYVRDTTPENLSKLIIADLFLYQDCVDDLCKVSDICFVSSTVVSMRIKESGFSGRVVLFSGSVVYMDEETVKKCDYVVHIPYMKADSDNLKTWMISPIITKTKHTGEWSDSRSSSRGSKKKTYRQRFNHWLRSIAAYFHLITIPEKPPKRHRRKRSKHNDSSIASSKAQSGGVHSSVHSASTTLRQRNASNPAGVSLFTDYIKRKLKRGLQTFGKFSTNDEPIHTYPLGTKFNFVGGKILFVDKFQYDVEMTFCMWRLLNPTGTTNGVFFIIITSYLSVVLMY